MNLQYFYNLKKGLNKEGLVITPGLTYENKKLKKIFSSIQRIDGNYLSDNDFLRLKKQNLISDSQYVKKIIKEFSYLCKIEEKESVIIFSQEKLQGNLIKIFFETTQSVEDMFFFLAIVSKYFRLNCDFSSIAHIANPLYGITVDIAQEKIVNFKIYLETENNQYYDDKLLSYKEIYPYLIMYSYKNSYIPTLCEYWSFVKESSISDRLKLTKDVFDIQIPHVDSNYFEYKEFQYSQTDLKMNFYLFDTSDSISRAKNDSEKIFL